MATHGRKKDLPQELPPEPFGLFRPLLLLLFCLSGVAALLLQVAWMRNLSLVFGVTTYATSTVVTAYMAGLALGSILLGRLVDRVGSPLLLLGVLEGGIGIFALLFPTLLGTLRAIYVALWPHCESHQLMCLIRLVLAGALLILPTLLMGGTLPVIVKAYARRGRRVDSDVGWLYTINNMGAVLGSVLTGFVLLEHFGIDGTARIGAAISFSVALVCLGLGWAGRRRRQARKPAAGAAPPERSGLWGK